MQKESEKLPTMNITIYGHAVIDVSIYTINGIFHEVPMPGGALFIQTALRLFQTQQTEPVLPISSLIPALEETFYKNNEEYRHEYKGLHKYEDINNRAYYAISRNLGYFEGKSPHNLYCVETNQPDTPIDLIIWDEGFGGLIPPKECRTALWASNKVLPNKEQFEHISDKCFLFIDANVLRSAGAMISRQISWERTTSELLRQLQNNSAISYLLKSPHLLITFAEDGAVYINNTGGQISASLILTHGGAEGSLREKILGQFDNTFAMMTAVLGFIFTEFFYGTIKPEKLRPVLEIGEGLMKSGYGIASDNISININQSRKSWTAFSVPLVGNNAFNQVDVNADWTITDNVGDRKLCDVAYNYVMRGSEVIDGLPQLSFGALTTIDRWEIEAYQNIRNLIIGYAHSDNVRPLSIAVFGSPGSGKSFGVTQIAQNILPGKVEKLEFNVSQFTSLADLGAAFQSVRDTILIGKLPLVFFDEFDSDRDGLPLGWIKSFLMPMQDGKFKDESGNHPIGKCILVFAGGTASSFEEFIKPMNLDGNTKEADLKAYERFKNLKGPDFISRLRGTINVLGPNKRNKDDKNYILRRALLLRGFCERKLNFKQNPTPVSRSIIHAMLRVPEYRHGARSMEAILDMSRIEGNSWEPASLPSHSQLALHVNADEFISLVLLKNHCDANS